MKECANRMKAVNILKSNTDEIIRKGLESKKLNWIMFLLVLGITFVYMVFLNSKTPLIADDFVYTFIFGTTIPVSSLGDIVGSQISYYLTWGGRVVAETLTQLFMFLGKDVFNIANSICYIVFCLCVYFLAVGRKIRWEGLLLTTILIWFFIPMFGQTVMWLTGACNYLWCGTLILLVLLPFRFYQENQTKTLKSWGLAISMVPLFFLSGITNENTAGAMILIMMLFTIVYYKRKIALPAFVYTGLFFSICGFFCMIFAPGNSMRVENESAVSEVTMMVGSNPIVTRLSYFAYNLYALMPLLLLTAIAFVILRSGKSRDKWLNFAIFVVAAAAAMLVMLLPPKFPPRAMFGLSALLIIAIVYALGEVELNLSQIKKNIALPAMILLSFYVLSLGYVGIDVITVNKKYLARIQMIEEQKNEQVVQLPAIMVLDSHNGMYGLKDVQVDPNHWVNRALADYFGVPDIVLKP